jgi:hypothetical protein
MGGLRECPGEHLARPVTSFRKENPMAYISAFDARGAVRDDFSDEEIATLDDAQKEVFFQLLGASNEERDADQEVADANQNETSCNRALAAAEEAHHRLQAPRTFLEELRAVINRPKY